MNSLDVLKAARELLSKEGSWTQGAFARDKDKGKLWYTDENACSYCSGGAIFKVKASAKVFETKESALDELLADLSGKDTSIVGWNDTPGRTQAEALAAFDKTIARLEAT